MINSYGSSGGARSRTSVFAGVGYISIMLIFTVICLTIFAVLSFQAAYSNNSLSSRGDEYTQQYYTADMAAKKILSELDSEAAELIEGFSFSEEFSAAAREISGGTAAQSISDGREGIRVDYSVEINERQNLSVSVLFYSSYGGDRYKILSWKCASESDAADNHQNVWDGGDLV